jgi:hypothetical protein
MTSKISRSEITTIVNYYPLEISFKKLHFPHFHIAFSGESDTKDAEGGLIAVAADSETAVELWVCRQVGSKARGESAISITGLEEYDVLILGASGEEAVEGFTLPHLASWIARFIVGICFEHLVHRKWESSDSTSMIPRSTYAGTSFITCNPRCFNQCDRSFP